MTDTLTDKAKELVGDIPDEASNRMWGIVHEIQYLEPHQIASFIVRMFSQNEKIYEETLKNTGLMIFLNALLIWDSVHGDFDEFTKLLNVDEDKARTFIEESYKKISEKENDNPFTTE